MTTPWIQIYSNLVTHRKTGELADALGLSYGAVSPNTVAAGMLVSLWTWAIQNAYDGDLSRCSPRSIADACGWRKKPDDLIRALKESRYIDDDMRLHDWDEYTILYINQYEARKASDRERSSRYRAGKKAAQNETASRDDTTSTVCKTDISSRDGNVTATQKSAPTVHNSTYTVQDNTEQNNFNKHSPNQSISSDDIPDMQSRESDLITRETYEEFCKLYGKDQVDRFRKYVCTNGALRIMCEKSAKGGSE